ncbi:helicase C-terminal domain-containing protein [Cokeromyces recurvatus]|uniref:helicase C-terminal domain-containing protein n=1 Tax=Cokeromyces recurvatus TaxID=90255 RepID=UPI00222060CE|nr:helicase C-terminal domain-containing protein [Cokeromyces recurvatus]KAI7902752.1 helicase C-terminal domain-containing protein [Cokeromyces recurvatus]
MVTIGIIYIVLYSTKSNEELKFMSFMKYQRLIHSISHELPTTITTSPRYAQQNDATQASSDNHNDKTEPESFGFPFEPYDIQRDFMKELYKVFSEGKLGIFESPTGTGKSLSLICGSLKWLKDNDEKEAEEDISTFKPKANQPDWITALSSQSASKKKKMELERKKLELKKRIDRVREIEEKQMMFELATKDRNKKRIKGNADSKEVNDDEFLLDDYESEEEGAIVDKSYNKIKKSINPNSNLSKEVQELLAKLESKSKSVSYDDAEDSEDEESELEQETKIYYASRTHSQLSQFVHEINKTVYAKDIYEVSLASRKQLCINEDVIKLKDVNKINEVCLELQKKGSKKGPCKYLPAWDNKAKWNEFRDHSLAKVRDIEDLVNIGKNLKTCPYYGSRYTVKSARLIVLPYQHLLHTSTRESLNISLKNNIVIIDEAHNLMETITSLYTVSLSLYQIQLAWNQLNLYIQKYKSRLAGKNVVYIKQILHIIKILIQHLNPKDESKRKDSVMGVNEFLHTSSIDHINMFKIKHYLEVSSLSRKLNGFIDKAREKEEEERQKERLKNPKAPLLPPSSSLISSTSTLTQIESFFMALTNPDKNGRIITSFGNAENPGVSIKYMLLNPADAFKPIVEEAKSIVLAGGTMEPISDFLNHLFPSVPKDRIVHFSCGHIIPPSNLSTMTLEQGPGGRELLFNFDSRQDVKLMDEVGQAIANLCNVIPDGVVCFFPSFTYLEQVYNRWATKESGNILERIERRKKIFKEPKESNRVESTLRDYALQIDSTDNSMGALLLCVVNGKMSEGINFSDRLGRGVIMIGLPFANRGSIELIEKIKYAQEHSSNVMPNAGKEYYENLCMRGVNQSIGRAIRHRNDYSVIILLDKRYATHRILKKLPKWIGQDVERVEKFGLIMSKTSKFFREKQNKTK